MFMWESFLPVTRVLIHARRKILQLSPALVLMVSVVECLTALRHQHIYHCSIEHNGPWNPLTMKR